MKDLFKTMVNHPIATWIVAGTLFGGIAQVISAARGEYNQTGLKVQVTSPEITEG